MLIGLGEVVLRGAVEEEAQSSMLRVQRVGAMRDGIVVVREEAAVGAHGQSRRALEAGRVWVHRR